MRFGKPSSTRKTTALWVVGIAVVAALGTTLGLRLSSGGHVVSLPTTGNYRPIYVPKPATGFQSSFVQGVDPDSLSKQGVDLESVISRIPGTPASSNRFRLTVSNTSALGTVDAFTWSPPNGVVIESVDGSSVGTCALAGTTGVGGSQFPTAVLSPHVACSGVHLKPPSCTCTGDGGSMTIEFVANEFPDFAGSVNVVSATPVLKLIPGYVQPVASTTCAQGQVSTAAKPCTPV